MSLQFIVPVMLRSFQSSRYSDMSTPISNVKLICDAKNEYFRSTTLMQRLQELEEKYYPWVDPRVVALQANNSLEPCWLLFSLIIHFVFTKQTIDQGSYSQVSYILRDNIWNSLDYSQIYFKFLFLFKQEVHIEI